MLGSEYVQAARLNGLPEGGSSAATRLRNALAPSVQVFAVSIQALFGGVIVTEVLFSYPGLGAQLVNAVEGHDTTLVQGIALLIATFYILVNVIADVVVVALVPRLRSGGMTERLRFARTGSGAVGLVLLVDRARARPGRAASSRRTTPAESLGLPGHVARTVRLSARHATSSGATCSAACSGAGGAWSRSRPRRRSRVTGSGC